MAFHATRGYDLITFDEATPSKDFDSGFPPTAAGQLSPIQEDLPSWRRSTPAEANHGETQQADVAATSGLQKTLLRVEQSLASVEERIQARDSQLYATVGEMAEKLRALELSQKKRDKELKRVTEQIRVSNTPHTVLRDSDKPLAPSPPRSVPRQNTKNTGDLRTLTPQAPKTAWNHEIDDDEDELWNTLEQIDQLAQRSNPGAQQPFLPPSPTPALSTKPRIRPSPYDGVSSWDDYRAQFELVAELNGWDGRTKAIYLAASLQGPARAILGDLDSSKRKDFSALIEALESRFGSKHQTEMYRAQLHCRMRKRKETLPELAQAVQRLTRQAYPNAPTSLQDTLARDHFIDALPESEVRWRIHQARPTSLRDALTTALEIEAFYVADRHRTRIQARAVFPPSPEAPVSTSSQGDDLQRQVGELRQVVSKLLTKQEQPVRRRDGRRRFERGYPPGNYSGCFTCGGLDHMQRDCPEGRSLLTGNGSQPGLRAGARLPPPTQGSRPSSQQ